MRTMTRFTSLALGLVVGPVLVAQSATGSISGQVKDNAGRPVANARITVTSKALFAPKQLTTDSRGEWRAFLLPPGDYKVVASKDGFVSTRAEDVRLGLGAAQRQDLVLKEMKTEGTTVEIVASSASGVDKSDVQAAVNFSASQLESMPTGAGGDRAFKGALSMSPGVVTETPSGRASIRGGSTQSVSYRVNGADVKNDFQGEMGEDNKERWVVEDNIEDIQVVLSPLHARFGRNMGGSINVVTKSGSNDWAASLRTSFSRDSWRALSPKDNPNELNRSDSLAKDFQVTLSGPIVKDRLWFSLATVFSPESSTMASFGWYGAAGWQRATWAPFATGNANIDAVTGAFNGGTFADPAPAPGTGVPTGYTYNRGDGTKSFPQTRKNDYLEAKLTGAIVPDHVVELSFMKAHEDKTNTDANDDIWHTTRVAALGTLKTERYNYALQYRGTLSTTLFLEAKYATNGRNVDKPLGDPRYGAGSESIYAYGSSHQEVANGGPYPNWRHGMPFGVWSGPGTIESKSASYNFNVKWIANQHEFDFGLDGYDTDYMTDSYLNLTQLGANNRQFNIGGQFSNAAGQFLFPVIRFNQMGDLQSKWDGYFPWDAGLAPTMIQYMGAKNAHTKSNNLGFYANDQWTVNSHWNVMLGLRFDTQKLKDGAGRELVSSTDLSPRLQVRYDIKGDSRSLITFSAAQYVGDFSQGFASAFVDNAQSKAIYYGMTHINGGATALPTPGQAGDVQAVAGRGNVDMYGVRFVDYATLTDPRNYTKVYKFQDNGKLNVLEDGTKAPRLDELSLSFGHSFESGSNVKATFVNRQWKRNWAIAEDYNQANQVLLTDPSNSGLSPLYGLKRRFFNSDDLKREYNGLELEWNVRGKGIWSWGGSWTYSRLVGNDEGGDDIASKSALRDNTPSQYYLDRQRLLAMGVSESAFAPNGRLGNDLTNRIRLYLTATVPFAKGGEISFSWMASGMSGQPWGVTNMTSLGFTNLGKDANGIAYTNGADRQYASYMGGRRPFEQNDVYRVDFRMAFKVPVSLWKVQMFGDVMINNFFNTVREGLYEQAVSGSASGISNVGASMGDPVWSDARAFTAPRSVTASLGFRF